MGGRAREHAGGQRVVGVVGERERLVERARRASPRARARRSPRSPAALRAATSATIVGPTNQPVVGHVVALRAPPSPRTAPTRRSADTRLCASASMTGPTCVAHVARMADAQLAGGADEPLDDLVVHAPRPRSAATHAEHFWPGVAERRVHRRGDRLVEVGVGVDDDRVLAAHLGDDPLDVALARRGGRRPAR